MTSFLSFLHENHFNVFQVELWNISTKKLKFHHDLTDWKGETEKPTVESFFAARDYNGALTLIDFETRIKGKSDVGEQKWAALAHIRLMNYSEAMKIYEKLVEKSDADPSLYCYLGPGYDSQLMTAIRIWSMERAG